MDELLQSLNSLLHRLDELLQLFNAHKHCLDKLLHRLYVVSRDPDE